MSQTPTVNHNFVLSPAGKGNIISYFFSLDLNKTLVRYPTFLFVRSFFMSLIKLIGLQESLLKCGLFCCNYSTKTISNQYLITGFTFNFVFLHKLSLVRLGIYLLGIESSQIMASDTFQHINVLGIGLYLQLKLIAFCFKYLLMNKAFVSSKFLYIC